LKELVEKALEVQRESFQEYLDNGYFESIFGEKKVDEAIPVISSWEFDTSDNAVFHYARISILNELLSEFNEHDPETCDECITARESGDMDSTGYEDKLEEGMCHHRYSVTFQINSVGFGETKEEAIDEARRYGLQDYIRDTDSFEVVKAVYANDQDTCNFCEEEE